MSDIKVQRGTNDNGTADVLETSFDAVSALTAAFEFNSNNRFQHQGSTSSAANMEGDDMSGGIVLTATDTLTMLRVTTSLSQNMRFHWEIVEYVGDPGGDNEFIIRSRNTVDFAASELSQTVALDTTPTNIDRCVPIITGAFTVHTSDGAACFSAYINDSGSLVVERGRTDSSFGQARVVVVEFTGSNWEVYHGTATSTGDTGTITLNTDSDGAGGSTGNVTDWATAFIIASSNCNDQAIADTSAIYQPGSGTTTVDWTFDGNHAATNKHFVHVVRNADMAVSRYTVTGNSGATTVNFNISSAGISDLSQAMVIGTANSSGTGTAYGRGWRNFAFTSTTNVAATCHRTGNTMDMEVQVVDFSGLTSGTANTLAADGTTYALAGQDAAFDLDQAFSIAADSGSYTLTGSEVTFDVDRAFSLSADPASYAWSGQDATLDQSLSLAADAGSYALSGSDVALTKALTLDAEAGSFVWSGADAGLSVAQGNVLAADGAAYALTGADVVFDVDRAFSLTADGTSYVWAGQDVGFDLDQAFALAAETAAYAWTGQDVAFDLVRSFSISAEPATFTLTGQSVALDIDGSNTLLAEGTAFSFAGQDAHPSVARSVVAENSAYFWSGDDVTLAPSVTPQPEQKKGGGTSKRRPRNDRLTAIRRQLFAKRLEQLTGKQAEQEIKQAVREAVDASELPADEMPEPATPLVKAVQDGSEKLDLLRGYLEEVQGALDRSLDVQTIEAPDQADDEAAAEQMRRDFEMRRRARAIAAQLDAQAIEIQRHNEAVARRRKRDNEAIAVLLTA